LEENRCELPPPCNWRASKAVQWQMPMQSRRVLQVRQQVAKHSSAEGQFA